jgi:hypothetical protein
MRSQITKTEAQAFKRRWATVNAAEREELQATTVAQKLRQLAVLMASAEELGWMEALAAEEAQVRDRWSQLRRAYDV